MRTVTDIDAEMDVLRAQIEPLQAALRDLAQERKAAVEAAATRAVDAGADDATVMSMEATSRTARKEFERRFRALHPALVGTTRFSSGADADQPWHSLVGPTLMLVEDAPAAYVTGLTAALVAFADRFCPDVPATAAMPGMVRGEVLADDDAPFGADDGRITLYYEPRPDGQSVLLVTSREGVEEFTGTLPAMLTLLTERGYCSYAIAPQEA